MVYKWIRDDQDFADQINSEQFAEEYLDAIEAKLAKLAVMDENPTVLIFLAKTKGKSRGYIEKTESEVKMTQIVVKPPTEE